MNEEVYTLPEVRAAFTKKYMRYLALLDHVERAENTLLEIGCGSGIFLEAALKYGWDVRGIDISQQAVELARRYCPSATLVCAPLERAGFDPSTCDLVALWDVIEHVQNPETLLGNVWSLLHPGGVLIMETPDEGCLARRLVRGAHRVTRGRVSFMSALYYPAHQWYFSWHAMSRVLQRVGFDHIRFYGEQTVKEFRKGKGTAYNKIRGCSVYFPGYQPQLVSAVFEVVRSIPWLRNKMVVIAAKPK